MKRLVFSFDLIVVSTRSWSLPMLVPGKDLVFALLMPDLKRWGVRIKSWVWVSIMGMPGCCPGRLVGWRALARMGRWFFANSRSLHSLSFVSPVPNLRIVLAQCCCSSGPTLASISFLGVFDVILSNCSWNCSTSSSSWSEAGP